MGNRCCSSSPAAHPPPRAGMKHPELFIPRVMCGQVALHSCSPPLPPRFLSSLHIFPKLRPKLHSFFFFFKAIFVVPAYFISCVTP